ncbi:MAG: O-antigen ligase family protein [Thermodesulfobacteriota bacterium]
MGDLIEEHLKNKTHIFLLPLAGLFLFVLPIPHILIIRESILFISIALMFYALRAHRGIFLETLASLRLQALLYALFIAWVLVLALFISDDRVWALKEIKTQWVMGSLALLLGAGVAALARKGVIDLRTVLTVIFWTLAIHIVAIDVDGIFRVITGLGGGLPFKGLTALTGGVGGLTIGPIDGSLLASLVFVFLLSEIILRSFYRKRLLRLSNALLVIFIILAVVSSILTGMRNIVEVPIIISSAILILIACRGEVRKKALYASVILVPVALAALFFTYKSDKRWSDLLDCFNLVMAQEEPAEILSKSKDFVYPELPDNKPVNISNFLRLTKYRVGVDIIRANPLGIGFGRNAFGHYLKGRYNASAGLNSDSSLLDMTIGTGLVGVGLFGALIFTILARSFRAFRQRGDFYALLLSLIIICFASRMVFDSVMRDHLLEIFMFITGLLTTRVFLFGGGPRLTLQRSQYRYEEVSTSPERMKAV